MKGRVVLLLAAMVELLIGSGCATNRGILDVRPTMIQQPASGELVKIERVTDKRVFELAPEASSIPSLKHGEIEDPAITARAIARKRNSYGKAMGDILLPEGRTVVDVVTEVLTMSFREAGYRVVTADDPAAGTAIPVEADIEQFWSWVTPGMWTISLEFEARVKITGDVAPFQEGEVVRGCVKRRGQSAGTKAWTATTNQGIGILRNNIKDRLAGIAVSAEE